MPGPFSFKGKQVMKTNTPREAFELWRKRGISTSVAELTHIFREHGFPDPRREAVAFRQDRLSLLYRRGDESEIPSVDALSVVMCLALRGLSWVFPPRTVESDSQIEQEHSFGEA